MMCKCWEEEPSDRPTFADISKFIGQLLNGEVVPTAGSDEDAGYYYGRSATKDIPDDYLDGDIIVESDDYIVPVNREAQEQSTSKPYTPVPAKRTNVPSATNDYKNNLNV